MPHDLETRSQTPSPSSDNVDARSKTGNTGATSRQVAALKRRYLDAYLVARSTNGFGMLIKIIAVIAGALLAAVGALLFNEGRGAEALGVAAIALGIVIAVLFYLLGILVSAQGQILKASLDAAVNTSPLLTNADRVAIMSLPEASSPETIANEAPISQTLRKEPVSARTKAPARKPSEDASGFSWDDL